MPELVAALADLLATDFAASPVMASGVGRTEFDERLDDVSAEAFEARDATAAALLARLDAIQDGGLTGDDAIDRDLARAVLRGRLIMAPFMAWRRDPVDLFGPNHERPVHPVPPPPPAGARPRGRRGRAPRAGGPGDRRRHRQPRPGPRPPAYRGTWPWRSSRRGAIRSRPRLARRRRPGGSRAAAPGRRACGAAPRPLGGAPRGRRRAGQRQLAARRGGLHADPARAGGAGRRRPLAPRPRPGGARAPRQRRWRRCPARPPATPTMSWSCARTTPTTRPPSPRCSRPTTEWTAKARELPRRHRPGHAPRGRVVRGRAVAGVPAARPRRGLVHRAARLLGPSARPLLRALRPRRRLAGGGPGAPLEQLLRRHPHDRRPRGVPGPPLAPGDAQAQPVGDPARVLDSLLLRGLGAVRGARDARAGFLRCRRSTCCSTSTRRCSGPRGSSWTHRSTLAR